MSKPWIWTWSSYRFFLNRWHWSLPTDRGQIRTPNKDLTCIKGTSVKFKSRHFVNELSTLGESWSSRYISVFWRGRKRDQNRFDHAVHFDKTRHEQILTEISLNRSHFPPLLHGWSFHTSTTGYHEPQNGWLGFGVCESAIPWISSTTPTEPPTIPSTRASALES